MKLNWDSDNDLRRLMSWLTRHRMAPKFGTTSIHNYQNAQFEAMRAIESRLRQLGLSENADLKVKGNYVYAKGHRDPIGSTREFSR